MSHTQLSTTTEPRPRMAGWVRLFAFWIGGVALLLGGCSRQTSGNDTFAFASPGGKVEFDYPVDERRAVSDISGPRLGASEKRVGLSDYQTQAVVINIWGSWCPPCRSETNGLIEAYDGTRTDRVEFLGINVKDMPGDGAAFQTSHKIPYPSIDDFSMRTVTSLRGFPTAAIPATIVLDGQHRVAHIWFGEVHKSELVSYLKV